eukprot:364703-Chlamydomonas_euryale.AAC.9
MPRVRALVVSVTQRRAQGPPVGARYALLGAERLSALREGVGQISRDYSKYSVSSEVPCSRSAGAPVQEGCRKPEAFFREALSERGDSVPAGDVSTELRDSCLHLLPDLRSARCRVGMPVQRREDNATRIQAPAPAGNVVNCVAPSSGSELPALSGWSMRCRATASCCHAHPADFLITHRERPVADAQASSATTTAAPSGADAMRRPMTPADVVATRGAKTDREGAPGGFSGGGRAVHTNVNPKKGGRSRWATVGPRALFWHGRASVNGRSAACSRGRSCTCVWAQRSGQACLADAPVICAARRRNMGYEGIPRFAATSECVNLFVCCRGSNMCPLCMHADGGMHTTSDCTHPNMQKYTQNATTKLGDGSWSIHKGDMGAHLKYADVGNERQCMKDQAPWLGGTRAWLQRRCTDNAPTEGHK